MMVREACGLILAGLVTASCAGDSGRTSTGLVVVDSAGVRMVSNTGPTRMLAATEVLRFGLVDGDPNLIFDQIRSLALDTDGSLWVVDSHESVRRYSEDGAYLGAVGGKGEGPGESPRGYGGIWCADTNVYALAYTPMLQVFTRDGRYLGGRSPIAPDGSTLLPLGPATEAWLFKRLDYPVAGAVGARESWTVSRGPQMGPAYDSLFTLSGPPRVPAQRSWSNGSYFDGFPSVVSDGAGTIYYSHASEYRIEVFSEYGVLESVVRRSVERRPYEAGFEDEIERGIGSASRTGRVRLGEDEQRRLLNAALPVSEPEWLPAIDQVLAAKDGGLWVRRADQHPSPALQAVARVYGYIPSAWLDEWKADWVFDVFEPDGEYRGTVVLPFEFAPMAVSSTIVYGSTRDELDVEYVVGFEVTTPDVSSDR